MWTYKKIIQTCDAYGYGGSKIAQHQNNFYYA
jgi:hypothetical protein